MDVAALHPDSALFLDFDGTLAPIQDDPDKVFLPEDGEKVLATLHQYLEGALVIISGRDIRDLSARIPEMLWRAGGHGLDICAPGQPPGSIVTEPPKALAAQLRDLALQHEGARLEEKGAVLALHYRAAPEIGESLANTVSDIVKKTSGYVMQHGKMVIETKPLAANKGSTLRTMMEKPEFARRVPVMVGDDVTDEDAMEAALNLGGGAIKVGDGASVATMWLDDPAAVWNWLKRSAGL
ncbi:MAG: trehalose-phosphatase [Pseudomonadota bacterium]